MDKGRHSRTIRLLLAKGLSKRPSGESAQPLLQALGTIRRTLEKVTVAGILWSVLDALLDAAPPLSLKSGNGRGSAAIEPPVDSH